MKQNELKKKLELHKAWLNEEPNGVKVDLRNADLQGNILRRTNLEGAILMDANLEGAILKSANLSYVVLEGANLKHANLKHANLKHANFYDADLRDADLRDADLRGVELAGADLRGADLDFSCLPLWCGGLDFKIDERIAKQIAYHLVNLMQYSELDTKKIFKKNIYKWLEDSHVVTEHKLKKLEEKENQLCSL